MMEDRAAVGDKRQTEREREKKRKVGRGGDRLLAWSVRDECSEQVETISKQRVCLSSRLQNSAK